MLQSDEALNERIHNFLRRKENKYPGLVRRVKERTALKEAAKAVDPYSHPYLS
jgi:hypothetical protein